MKKSIIITVSVILLFVALTSAYISSPTNNKITTPKSTAPTYLLPPGGVWQCGDCDGNGFVNIEDAHRASLYSAGLANLSDDEFYYCNVKGVPGNRYIMNSQVSILDALTIARYVVGLVPELKCGRPIVYIRQLIDSTGNGSNIQYLMRMDHDGKNNVILRNSTFYTYANPEISPDSTKIAYRKYSNLSNEILIMNIDGQIEYSLVSNRGADNPSWSPDGTKIAFEAVHRNESYYGDMTKEIDVIDTNGANRQQLTNNSASDEDPHWSPDGKKILFNSVPTFLYPRANHEIVLMYTDGSNRINITNHRATDNNPSWSPDGKKILFSRTFAPPYYTTRYEELYKMDPDGSNRVLITNTSSLLLLPIDIFWASDDNFILSDSNNSDYNDIYRTNNTYGHLEKLTNTTIEWFDILISPHG